MGKRSVKVNTFFPRRIFSPDIWGSDARKENPEEYDEYKIISKFAANTIPSNNAFTTRGQRYSSSEQNDFGFVGNYLDENPFTSAPGSRKSYKTFRGTNTQDVNYNEIDMEDLVETPLSKAAPLTYALSNDVRPSALQEPVIPFTQNVEELEKQKEIITLEQDELTAFYRPAVISNDIQEIVTPEVQIAPTIEEDPIEIAQQAFVKPEVDEPESFESSPQIELDAYEPTSFIAPEPTVLPEAAQAVREISEYERLVKDDPEAYYAPEIHENSIPQGDFDYFALNITETISHPHNDSLQFANSEFVSSQIENYENEEVQAQNDIFERVLQYKKQIIIAAAVVVFIICAAVLYLSFTGSDSPKATPIPAELNTNNISGEKPVILVPTDKDNSNVVLDQNGNVVGQ